MTHGVSYPQHNNPSGIWNRFLCFPLVVDIVEHPQQDTRGEKRSGRQDHDQDIGVSGTQYLVSKDLTRTEDLTACAQEEKGEGKAHSHPEAVHNRTQHRVPGSESLRTSQYKAIDNDKGDEESQGLVQLMDPRVHGQVHDGDKRSDDDDEGRYPDFARDDVPEGGYDRVGAHQDERRGQSHADILDV